MANLQMETYILNGYIAVSDQVCNSTVCTATVIAHTMAAISTVLLGAQVLILMLTHLLLVILS